MRRGGRLLVLLGIVLGIMTAGLVFLSISSAQPAQPQVATRPVVIAAQNVGARSEITIDSLTVAQWPENAIPPGAFSSTQDVAGKLALDSIYQGQIILPPMIVDKTRVRETRSNAAFVIPEGRVAMAFQFSSLSGVANALVAGDTVDMLLTLQPPQVITPTTGTRPATTTFVGTEGEQVTQLFLQDVLILNVGNWPTPGTQGQAQQQQQAQNILTLALDRQDAIALKAARELGQIDLVLRRAGDHRPATTEPVTREYLNRRFNFRLLPLSR